MIDCMLYRVEIIGIEVDSPCSLYLYYSRILLSDFHLQFCEGVISELARERVEREHNLTDSTDSTTAESLARATKEIVESRDIKALVKKAADSLEQQRDDVVGK